jgi:hypothetical protein
MVKKEEGKTKGCGHLQNRDLDPQLEKMLDPDPKP